jgi:hypothetical protein
MVLVYLLVNRDVGNTTTKAIGLRFGLNNDDGISRSHRDTNYASRALGGLKSFYERVLRCAVRLCAIEFIRVRARTAKTFRIER